MRASSAMPLSLDEILAPAAERVPSTPYVFQNLRGQPRLDLLPMSSRNARWLEHALAHDMRQAAEQAPGVEGETAYAAAKRAMHESVEMLASSIVVGFSVREEPDADWTPRPYTPELGASFLHRLIDLEQGVAEFTAFQAAVAEISKRASKSTLNPEKTAGNSSGG